MVANSEFHSPFSQGSMAAFLLWLEVEWAKYTKEKLSVSLVGNVADLRKIQDNTRTIRFPYVAVSLARIEINTDKGGLARRYNALTTSLDLARSKARVHRMTPVKIGFMAQFSTDNIDHVYTYASMLANNAPGPSFYLEDDTGFRIESRVIYDTTFDIPQADISSPGDKFVVEVPAYVTSYVGTVEEIGLIREIKVSLVNGSDTIFSKLQYDIKEKKINELQRFDLKYTDPFDKSSTQWRE